MKQGLCQCCGGVLKGLFTKKCSQCGKLANASIALPAEPVKSLYQPSAPQKPKTKIFTPMNADSTASLIKPIVNKDYTINVSFGNIVWKVLAVEDDRVLVISENVLELQKYNYRNWESIREESCLRKYLNNEFYNRFGAIKEKIAETLLINSNNPEDDTYGGSSTFDKIFLLSIDEASEYLDDRGLNANDENGKVSDWWLRSPGKTQESSRASFYTASYVFSTPGGSGRIMTGGNTVDGFSGVRPALWLNL